MRRGTKAAELFGDLLRELRVQKGFSMQYVSRQMGVAAAHVSQCEKAQRAVKEPKIEDWARALEVDMSFLRKRWLFYDLKFPAPPVVRRRSRGSTKSEVQLLFEQLVAPDRERVIGYIHRLIEEREEDLDKD